jgi:hypothetical protein
MIPVTIEHDIFRLEADTTDEIKDEYGLPASFGPRDGVIRFTIRPNIAGYHVHAVQLYARQALLDDVEGLGLLETRALFFASEAYERQYGLPIEKTV